MLQPIAAVAARNNDAFTPLCTGFFFSEKPLLLTVAHSIPVAEQLVVMICDEVETYPLVNPTPRQLRITPAKLVDRDPRVDLALLEVQGATVTMKRERFLRGEDPPVGTSVAIGGFPFMPKLMVPVYRTGAICSKFTRTDLWGSTRMYMADVQCHQGDSGAPIVDLASNSVAGMVAGRFDPIESTGLGFGPSGPSIRGLPYNLAVVIRSNEICDFIKNSGAL
jgi:S1-C subfamily serine protease